MKLLQNTAMLFMLNKKKYPVEQFWSLKMMGKARWNANKIVIIFLHPFSVILDFEIFKIFCHIPTLRKWWLYIVFNLKESNKNTWKGPGSCFGSRFKISNWSLSRYWNDCNFNLNVFWPIFQILSYLESGWFNTILLSDAQTVN